MHSPYQPPQARVADVQPLESRVRPRSATIALCLYGLYIASQVYRLRFPLEQVRTGEISGLAFLLHLAAIGLLIVVGVLLAMRVSWARWGLVAWFGARAA